MPDDIDLLLRRLIGGDDHAAAQSLDWASDSESPALLVAAALVSEESTALLRRATSHAVTTRDRQLVALAAAHLNHDTDLLDALVRDHLADHPDNLLAAWIATQHTQHPPRPDQRPIHKEQP